MKSLGITKFFLGLGITLFVLCLLCTESMSENRFIAKKANSSQNVFRVCKPCGENMCRFNGKCLCKRKYIWSKELQKCLLGCNPICELNSFCNSMNECKCNMGYIRESNDSTRCIFAWWIYLIFALFALVILITAGCIIFCCVRPKTLNYYPSGPKDTSAIVNYQT